MRRRSLHPAVARGLALERLRPDLKARDDGCLVEDVAVGHQTECVTRARAAEELEGGKGFHPLGDRIGAKGGVIVSITEGDGQGLDEFGAPSGPRRQVDVQGRRGDELPTAGWAISSLSFAPFATPSASPPSSRSLSPARNWSRSPSRSRLWESPARRGRWSRCRDRGAA